MKIEARQFILDKPDAITVEYLENQMSQSGCKPLRWAIVGVDNNKLKLDAVVIID